jgi:hypothetical protein
MCGSTGCCLAVLACAVAGLCCLRGDSCLCLQWTSASVYQVRRGSMQVAVAGWLLPVVLCAGTGYCVGLVLSVLRSSLLWLVHWCYLCASCAV